MGPKLVNCCKPEQVGTKEHGKMLKLIQVLEYGGSWQRRQEARGLKDKREEIREKRIRGFLNKFELEGFMAQEGLWNLGGEKELQDGEELPKEEGDVIRE